MNQLLILISVITIIFNLPEISCKGTVSLDEFSFDKVIKRFPAVLVKFDVAFPYGDKHDIFQKLAEDTSKSSDLLLAQVGVKDYGEKENEILAIKYKVKKEDFPLVKLFIKDTEKPIDFPSDSEFKLDALKKFIKDNSGVYIGLPGCIKEFDKLSLDFIKGNENKRQTLLGKAETLSTKYNKEEQISTKVYITVMKKIIESGDSFITKETERIEKILKGKLTEKKQTEMQERLNILKSFSLPKKDEL